MDNEEEQDIFSRLLEIFDGMSLEDMNTRRMALKPLYDYLQKLLLGVGIHLCNIDESRLSDKQLALRWYMIKPLLAYVDDPAPWIGLIEKTHELRRRVEHEDYFSPPAEHLEDIRENAPKFKEWLIKAARKYYKTSKDFDFKDAFYKNIDRYIREGEFLLDYLGENPHIAYLEEDAYGQLPEFLERLHVIKERARKLKDLEGSDLEDLIKIAGLVEKISGREYMLTVHGICPKCGGKIKSTQKSYGGGYDEPPTQIHYRVGCENCDYELHSETINI